MKLSHFIGLQLGWAICPCEKAKAHHAAQKHTRGLANALSFAEVELLANTDVEAAIPADDVYEGLTPEVALKTNEAMLKKAKASLGSLERTGKNDLSQVEAAKALRKSAESRRLATEELLGHLTRAKAVVDSRLAQEASNVVQNSNSDVDQSPALDVSNSLASPTLPESDKEAAAELGLSSDKANQPKEAGEELDLVLSAPIAKHDEQGAGDADSEADAVIITDA